MTAQDLGLDAESLLRLQSAMDAWWELQPMDPPDLLPHPREELDYFLKALAAVSSAQRKTYASLYLAVAQTVMAAAALMISIVALVK